MLGATRNRLPSCHLDDAPLVERDRAPANETNELAVMGCDDDGRATGVDLAQQVHDLERKIGIAVAGRLIGQHQRGIVDKRPRDGNPLLFAAGQISRIGIHAVLESHPLEDLERAPPLLRRWNAEDFEHERDVLENGPRRNELEVLEDEPNPAPIFLESRGGGGCWRLWPLTKTRLSLGVSDISTRRRKVDLPRRLGRSGTPNSPFSTVSDSPAARTSRDCKVSRGGASLSRCLCTQGKGITFEVGCRKYITGLIDNSRARRERDRSRRRVEGKRDPPVARCSATE